MDGIAVSDLHGYLLKIDIPFDMMFLPGDVCPVWNHDRKYQKEWLNNVFAEWVKGLPFKNETSRVIMCGGNHDLVLENFSYADKKRLEELCNGRLIYLDNEGTVVTIYEGEEKGYTDYQVFATPYCKIFGSWAFMRSDEALEEYYKMIPEHMDFVISHDAADINDLGLILMGMYRGENAGNKILAKHIERAKPKYYFCGHIHSGNHLLTDINGTKMANVSLMDEDYNSSHFPLVFKYEKD